MKSIFTHRELSQSRNALERRFRRANPFRTLLFAPGAYHLNLGREAELAKVVDGWQNSLAGQEIRQEIDLYPDNLNNRIR